MHDAPSGVSNKLPDRSYVDLSNFAVKSKVDVIGQSGSSMRVEVLP